MKTKANAMEECELSSDVTMSELQSSGTVELHSLLREAVATAREEYTKSNPNSLKAYNEACKYMPGGNTRTVLHSSPFPLTFSGGSGAMLISLDHHAYIDFLGEYTAGIYGHNNLNIRNAVEQALKKGFNLGGNNTYEKELAKTVCQRFSPTMELVRFTNSGTEANMCAVAAAIAWTGRKKILVFSDGYHGSTIGFAAGAQSMNLPHDWVVGTYNDVSKTQALLDKTDTNELAAILVEPMLGSGGAIPGSLEFLQFLRGIATAYNILLIFDEVMTSRLSYRGRAHALGIRPDLMTLGKWVGGGMSFGAFGGRREIMEMFDPRIGKLRHAGTFNNNVVSMAAGCAGCALLDAKAIDKLNAQGLLLKDKVDLLLQISFKQLSEGTHGMQSQRMWLSGIGSILNVHFGGPGKQELQELFFHHMLQENIYLAQRGFMALSIETSIEHVQAFTAAVEKFISKYAALLRDVENKPSVS